ncbi:hypothetical protein N4T36_13490 [Acinetobacter baumannii]|uniref:hypothetical protein n=1 Tax=Acinetobacter baumannii TaxID=470 RepID=UPI0002BAF7B9|nr:hypothetical protein [Acinetobacter baumannii]UWY67450.1 hypothetical protein N4T40_13455 [Acinetobacter baumannii]UWY74385.1 hypothetical protein N4T41_08455 [Acinetobacter baumannii]UWY75755.1 hypothetical protein N4T35_13160 [Acinetobacter baumannii]UWY79979.1 hypothetical protein N4T36_13490 [Acinetobacter baumannii]UWY84570.1 hypothetical protein N4T37_15415 [Acinetobacter baumannii]
MSSKVLNELEEVVFKYINDETEFCYFKGFITDKSNALNDFINFRHDLVMVIENWFEYVEFCYLEENWKKYALELGFFLIDGIKNYPNEVHLPLESIIEKEQFSRYLS